MTTEKEIREISDWRIAHVVEHVNWWKEQRTWNARQEKIVQNNTKKIGSINLKITWVAGAAAAIGSFLAVFVTSLLK